MSNFTRRWALVEDGKVVKLEHADHSAGHPFGDLADNQRAFDVSGVECFVGFVSDEKGNVAAGKVVPKPGKPVYHDDENPDPVSTIVQHTLLSLSEPHPSLHPAPKADEASE